MIDLRQDVTRSGRTFPRGNGDASRNARGLLQVASGAEIPNGREVYADLMETLFAREKFRLLTREQLYGVFDEVYDGTYGQAFFGLADGKPVCVAGISKSGKIASYLHAARTDDAMNGAASLSLWSGIEWAKASGCQWFDLGGIIPERNRERLARFANSRKVSAVRSSRSTAASGSSVPCARQPRVY